MSRYTGKDTVISVGDRVLLRLATYTDLTEATTKEIRVYSLAAFAANSVNPAPLQALTATLATGSPSWKLEAEAPTNLFSAEGRYVLRSFASWSSGRRVLGAPMEIYVLRGSA